MTPSDTAHPEGERELLPCPFHGCGARMIRDGGLSWIECDDFGCNGSGHETDAAAIAAWNTRPVVRPQGEEGLDRDEALIWFLKVLNGAGGRAEASDYPWSTLNVFCDDREPTDTFNLAIEQGLTRTTHDSDTDASTVYLTDAGRAFLAALSNQGKPSS